MTPENFEFRVYELLDAVVGNTYLHPEDLNTDMAEAINGFMLEQGVGYYRDGYVFNLIGNFEVPVYSIDVNYHNANGVKMITGFDITPMFKEKYLDMIPAVKECQIHALSKVNKDNGWGEVNVSLAGQVIMKITKAEA